MQVPSIDDLQRVFGQRPVSVAEVSLGEVLPLDRWPDGEVVLTAEVAGRAAHVHLHPNADRLGIQIDVSSPVVVLSLDRVQRVDALLSDHVRGLSFITRTADGERSWILRTHPDIELRSE